MAAQEGSRLDGIGTFRALDGLSDGPNMLSASVDPVPAFRCAAFGVRGQGLEDSTAALDHRRGACVVVVTRYEHATHADVPRDEQALAEDLGREPATAPLRED